MPRLCSYDVGVSLSCPALPLALPTPDKEILLVHAVDAIRLCRDDGYQPAPRIRASWEIDRLERRDMCRTREFVERTRLLSVPLCHLTDDELLAAIRRLLAQGDLAVLVRTGDGGGDAADKTTAERRRLARQIERLAGSRLTFEGRRYRLVADVDLARLPDRDYYEVTSRADAVRVLTGMAALPTGAAELPPLLTDAKNKLSADWRPPLSPDGLILLRRIVVAQAVNPIVEAPITPSQMKALLKSDWIEIEVVDDEDELHVGPFRLVLPDDEKMQSAFDGTDFFSKHGIASGSCKLVLLGEQIPAPAIEEPVSEVSQSPEAVPPAEPTPPPEVDAPDWEELPSLPSFPAEPSTTWLSFKLVDEQSRPIANRRFRLECADQSTREGVFSNGEIRFEDVPPGGCTLLLLPADAAES
jgi:hypothetical protein